MATETFELGSSPIDEDCAQVGSENYDIQSRAECYAYLNQLYRFLRTSGYNTEKLPGDFRLFVKTYPHDFGNYREVVAKFDANNEKAWDIALLLERSGPEKWDGVARAEIADKVSACLAIAHIA